MFCLALLCASAVTNAASTPRPDLSGKVTLENGAAVANATVFIYTAGPKFGTASLCPSCYPDCQKKAQTNAKGEYKIESLDPNLLFRLLVVASGYQPKFVPKTDPASGAVNIQLRAPDALSAATRLNMAGVVLDAEGQPLNRAVIDVQGIEMGVGGRWGGVERDTDPVAVTDAKGHFLITCQPQITAVRAIVDGPNVAKHWVTLKPGRDHVITMEEGVTVKGRVVQNGKPLHAIGVGLVTADMLCGNYLTGFESMTDENGRFLIMNVTPGKEYRVFSKMDSLAGGGALPLETVRTESNGTTLDVGDLEVQPAYRVSGQISLSDGQLIPPGTRISLGRELAWDNTEVELDPAGRFEFKGLLNEPVALNVRIRGYRFSKKNPSLDWLGGGIVGRVNGDVANLNLVMDPGEWQFDDRDPDMPSSGDKQQPTNYPLRGVADFGSTQIR